MDKKQAIKDVLDILRIDVKEDTILYKALDKVYQSGNIYGWSEGYREGYDDCRREVEQEFEESIMPLI